MRQPIIIPVLYQGRERYQVFAPYPYLLDGIEETIPEGMIVDGASVPRLAWPFMPPDGIHRAGVLPHDDVYGRQGKMPSGRQVTRATADLMLYARLIEAGVSRIKALIVYRAVRRFGGIAWNNSTGTPIILPVRNAAPSMASRPNRTRLTRHIYQTDILP